jgi:hypothetical protein
VKVLYHAMATASIDLKCTFVEAEKEELDRGPKYVKLYG